MLLFLPLASADVLVRFRKLTHVFYKCEYHIVFTPKYRFRILEGTIKLFVEQNIQLISEWKDVKMEELNVQKDHVHLLCSIPPKISIFEFMGTLKGKLAMKVFTTYSDLNRKPYWGIIFGQGVIYKHS